MSAGTIYAAGIGRVLYAAGTDKLKELNTDDDNLILALPCRTIFSSGNREIEVIGPVAEMETRFVQAASVNWEHRNGHETMSKAASIRSNGTSRGHTPAENNSVVTTWTHEDSVLSSIGEDGEYKADLDIDWMK
jgi:hypothetical protein